jgi:hypothetical protein
MVELKEFDEIHLAAESAENLNGIGKDEHNIGLPSMELSDFRAASGAAWTLAYRRHARGSRRYG